jgi:hypothetical protein
MPSLGRHPQRDPTHPCFTPTPPSLSQNLLTHPYAPMRSVKHYDYILTSRSLNCSVASRKMERELATNVEVHRICEQYSGRTDDKLRINNVFDFKSIFFLVSSSINR